MSMEVSLSQEGGSRFNSEVAYACDVSRLSVSGLAPFLPLFLVSCVPCKVSACGYLLTSLCFLLHAFVIFLRKMVLSITVLHEDSRLLCLFVFWEQPFWHW